MLEKINDRLLLSSQGMHAREWIGPAVATYMIREWVENNEAHSDILDNVNIHFIAVANPDGYMYSRETVREAKGKRKGKG